MEYTHDQPDLFYIFYWKFYISLELKLTIKAFVEIHIKWQFSCILDLKEKAWILRSFILQWNINLKLVGSKQFSFEIIKEANNVKENLKQVSLGIKVGSLIMKDNRRWSPTKAGRKIWPTSCVISDPTLFLQSFKTFLYLDFHIWIGSKHRQSWLKMHITC